MKLTSLQCLPLLLAAIRRAWAETIELRGKKDARIIGGERAESDSFPFFVRLAKPNVATSNGEFHCGGTLIDAEWVLSAAHCDVPELVAFVGPDNMNDPIRVVEHFPHPDYDASRQRNDFLLLKLAKPVIGVTPVELATEFSVPNKGEELVVIGKGTTETDSYQPSQFLLQTTVTAWSHQECAERYRDLTDIVDEIMICAGGDGQDSCMGDSGSAIMTKDFVQLGVVSFGVSCANPEWPGVYARVAAIADWTEKVMCENAVFDRSNPNCRKYRGNKSSDRLIKDRDYDVEIPIDVPEGKSEETCWGSNCNLRRRCRDDELARFAIGNSATLRDCRWINRYAVDKKRACAIGGEARDRCKRTCQTCDLDER